MASHEGDTDAQSATLSDPLIGQTVGGRFVIQGRIARGGMACVYAATQTQVDRPVAVKVLRPNLDGLDGSAADFRRRFLQEASILSRLQHPNLVTLLDYGQITQIPGDHYYIAMEYLRGKTLSRHFREKGRLDVGQAIRIARQVGRGLREAHRQGFIHRDLKPSNIMLVPEDDENEIVKLIDFGIGKAVERRAYEQVNGPDAEEEEMTRVGLLLGSPSYMAPEQIRGETVEPRTDVYGLGIVLFQALTGRLPFEGKSQVDLMLAHCSIPPPPLDDFLEMPVPSLSTLIAETLRKSPSERPSVDEFLACLANVEQDLFGSIGLAGPTLLGARFSFPPPDSGSARSSASADLRPPPSADLRPSASPSRRPSPPPLPRSSRSDPATVVARGNFVDPRNLAAPKPLDPALLNDLPTSPENRLAPQSSPAPRSTGPRASATLPAVPHEPQPSRFPQSAVASSFEPQQVLVAPPAPKGSSRKLWALAFVPVLGILLWLGLRPAPQASPVAAGAATSTALGTPVPSAPTPPTPANSTPSPATPGTFTLYLDASPGRAVVSEDGTVLGKTPLRLAIERSSVSQGRRRFSLERDGYAPYVHWQADSTRDVEVIAQLSRAEKESERSTRSRIKDAPSTEEADTPVTPPPHPKPPRSLDINLER